MKKAILATKIGMTQIFNEDGTLIPVTVLQAGPCVVTQIKTVENDGYEAVQVGFVDMKNKEVKKDGAGKKTIVHAHGTTRPLARKFEKVGVTSKRYLREFKFENASEYALAQEIKADIFVQTPKSFTDCQKILAEMRILRPWGNIGDVDNFEKGVLTVHVQAQVEYSREKACLVRWVARRLQYATLRL